MTQEYDTDDLIPIPFQRYAVTPNGVVIDTRTRSPALPVRVAVDARVTEPDGYVVRLDGVRINCDAERLRTGEAWDGHAIGVTNKRGYEALHGAIRELAKANNVPTISGGGRPGWRQPPDRPAHYAMPGGWLTDGGTWTRDAVWSDLPAMRHDGAFDRTPDPAASPDYQAALDWYASVGRRSVVLIMLGAALRSLVWSISPARTSLLVRGVSGTGKTSAAGLVRSVAGAYWSYGEYPAITTAGTVASLEIAIDRHHDLPLLIDDVRLTPTGGDSEAKKVADLLEGVVRAAYNRGAIRARAQRDMRPAPEYTVGSVPIITGEAIPPVLSSLLGRLVLIDLAVGDIDLDAMAAGCERHGPALQALGWRVVRDVAKQLNAGIDVGAIIHERTQQEAALLATGMAAHLAERTPQARRLAVNGAYLIAGLALVCERFGLTLDTDRVRDDLVLHLVAQEREIAGHATGGTHSQSLTGWARDLIVRLLAGGAWHIHDTSGQTGEISRTPPPMAGVEPEQIGWRRVRDDWAPLGAYAGTYHPNLDAVALLPDALWAAMLDAARKEHVQLPSRASLWSDLARGGLLDAGDRALRAIRVGPVTARRVVIPRDALWGDGAPD